MGLNVGDNNLKPIINNDTRILDSNRRENKVDNKKVEDKAPQVTTKAEFEAAKAKSLDEKKGPEPSLPETTMELAKAKQNIKNAFENLIFGEVSFAKPAKPEMPKITTENQMSDNKPFTQPAQEIKPLSIEDESSFETIPLDFSQKQPVKENLDQPKATANEDKAPRSVVSDKQEQVNKVNSGEILESTLNPGTQKTAAELLTDRTLDLQEGKGVNNNINKAAVQPTQSQPTAV